MSISHEKAQLRARIAGRKRQNPNADVADDQRELKTLSLEEHIRRVVENAPAPTPEQIARLRALLPPVD
ncbi:hypothetical protein I2W78_18650 [Streptomyces spinoverrucosus]|uniref:hypothetical protein n=1 Tax=Streptomyces spinoverrucosus TaxID=284043 RepID=UPI0018C3E5AE|nr:hypothetical protein [Streptomyces spinoverrucosus]MBG0853813.1 hypothetical protein [Streptomyces spinoverrucosus]